MKNSIKAYALLVALLINNKYMNAMGSREEAGPAMLPLYALPAGPLTETEDRALSRILLEYVYAQRKVFFELIMTESLKEAADTALSPILHEYAQEKLFEIAMSGENPECIRLLMLRGADINKRHIGDFSALELASGAGHLATVKELLALGAKYKDSALLCATKSEHKNNEVICLLKKHGAQLDQQTAARVKSTFEDEVEFGFAVHDISYKY